MVVVAFDGRWNQGFDLSTVTFTLNRRCRRLNETVSKIRVMGWKYLGGINLFRIDFFRFRNVCR